METRIRAAAPHPGRHEAFRAVALLLLFLAVNLATADLFPVVWLDEALHVDPAVNLWLGEGLRSTAWGGQSVSETWVGYTPGYVVLLSGWLHVFGFSLLSVRSLGHVLGLAAVGLCWLAVRRHGLLRTEPARLLFVVLGACGAGISFSYRCGRPDAVVFLVVSLGFFASSLRNGALRGLALLAVGALVPVAGLQGLAFTGVLGTLLVVFWWRRALLPVALFATGGALGLAGLVLGLSCAGLWERFRDVTLLANGVGRGALGGALARLELFPRVSIEDPSGVLLTVFCLVLLAVAARTGRTPVLPPALFGAASAVLIPTALCAAGRYALYYSWMTWVPLAVATLAAGEAWGFEGRARRAFRAVLVASACVGLPAQLALGLVNFRARSYARVEEVVRAGVPPGSVAYCDASAYYAARIRAARLVLPSYNRQLTEVDLRSIEAVVLRTGDLYVYEAPHPEVERAFAPLDAPAPPEAVLRAWRLHWIYEDYATLRAWGRRPGAPAAGPRPPPSLPAGGGAPR
ncbi:MAG: hypothetical protein RBU36_10305 [Thermoanaerobaculia bacterium]|nr:hypothetical protein [Thermoanaerobaculia bacterium]